MIKSTVLLYLVIGIGIGIGIGYLGLNPQVNELQGSIQYKDEQIRDLRQEQISDKNNIANLEFDLVSLETEIDNNKQSILKLDEQINELNNEISRQKVNEELNKDEIKELKGLRNELEIEKAIIAGNNKAWNVPNVATSIKRKTNPKKNAIIIFPKNIIFLKIGVYSIKIGILQSTIRFEVKFKKKDKISAHIKNIVPTIIK